MIPAPTIQAGSRCLIRIAPALLHVEGERGYTVSYMGSEFIVARQETIEVRDGIVVAELPARVIKSTGRASFLVLHQGHALRVHVQQIRALEEVYR